MAIDIGGKIKELRVSKNLTLKELSEKVQLSIGFLSQLERGLTNVAVDSLEKIAEALEVDLSYFFSIPKSNNKSILRSYEQEIFQVVNSQFINYHLTNDLENKVMVPRLVQILPSNTEEDVTNYNHEGEEFVYVLEGILTLYLDNEKYELYPGDSIHINSTTPHNWANYTNKLVKLLAVNTPNHFKGNKCKKFIK
ncbi:helix-turn-helix domain-containing protein [Haloimpatiens massiliensis]|uniref:helix-turn-helix domain-containing protein n=1 Tax=Haloimpatiens massiliensis TaxID=1658110 RepID=UPI000C833079|nr:cupin domain-containing protein [Haloimpatiens massiliensis]